MTTLTVSMDRLMVEVPAALGYAFVVAQAAIVALLAELEYSGLRKAAS